MSIGPVWKARIGFNISKSVLLRYLFYLIKGKMSTKSQPFILKSMLN